MDYTPSPSGSKQIKLQVSHQEAGATLHRFLISHLALEFSGKAIKKLIETQCCKINGRTERFGSTILLEGDQVVLQTPSSSSARLHILYEDEEILAIDKWAGLVCDQASLQKVFPGLQWIHRLDRDTTGVVLLAKTDQIKTKMIELFRTYRVEKTYLALSLHTTGKDSGVITDYMYPKSKDKGQTLWASHHTPPGDQAITQWKVIERAGGCTLFMCKPRTGRTHQLRVHLKSLGCPLLGDPLYAKDGSQSYAKRHMLHAMKIEFPHPGSQQQIMIQSSAPQDMSHVWKELGGKKLEDDTLCAY